MSLGNFIQAIAKAKGDAASIILDLFKLLKKKNLSLNLNNSCKF